MSIRSERDPRRLAVVGTDLKFISSLIERLDESGDYEIRIDEWPKLRAHDETVTREILTWAETIVCEWAGPNAVAASRHKKPGQRLIVRLHRMELDHPEWRDIDIDQVDCVVTVGPYYRRRVLEVTGWPKEKVMLVPNLVDVAAFDLPKAPEARHRLGMIGAASARKRLDLALDALRELRELDDRYQLAVKGSIPWGLKWVDDRPEEQAYFDEIATRLEEDLLLAGAVHFDPPGPDVASWLQDIGFLLSTSDDESFHLSPAEGMASRAVPVIRPWPGADEVYDPEWVVDGPTAMARRILEVNADPLTWSELGERARQEILDKYAIDDVVAMWRSTVLQHPLRVSVVSTRNPYADPGLMADVHSLRSVGHHVSIVSRAKPPEAWIPGVATPEVSIGSRRLSWSGLMRRFRNRPPDEDAVARAMSETLAATEPDLVYPQRSEDLSVADSAGAPVLRQPTWPLPKHDLVSLAPRSPTLSVSPTTPEGTRRELPAWPSHVPEPHRHTGKSAVIAYRVTPTSPGRYLESALTRAGVSVTVLDGELAWARVPPGADVVVIVESAYPAFEVHGEKPNVPTFFWVHHGEHHLAANLRLTRRYQVDGVLMAHSWHLAHRFPVPTYRFPFGVATELIGRAEPWHERTLDVAMVGSGIGGTGNRYDRRREIIEALDAAPDIGTRLAYGIPPDEMLALYGDSRIVVNDAGPRHFPITMRVFEAIGAGALLLTEDIPGTDTLFEKGAHYIPMERDVLTQIRAILESESPAGIAESGRAHALSRHTYDHRVDRLLELAADTRPERRAPAAFPPRSTLAAVIDQDVDVQQLAAFGDIGSLGLDDRALRTGDAGLAERSIDAVALGAGPIDALEVAVLAARGYVYATESHHHTVREILAEQRPEAAVTVRDGILRADIGGTPYRMRPADHPLAK